MTQTKTINEQIEELKEQVIAGESIKKSVNKSLWEGSDDELFLVENKAKLSTLQECQKMFLEEIDDRIKLIEEVKKDSDEIEKRICDSKLMELIKLKSKIGGEDDTK